MTVDLNVFLTYDSVNEDENESEYYEAGVPNPDGFINCRNTQEYEDHGLGAVR